MQLPECSALGHSRRYGYVRSLVCYRRYRTLPRPTETRVFAAFLRPIRKQRAQPPQLRCPGVGRAGNVKRLTGRPGARLRIGDWRVIFVETTATIEVRAVGNRRDIYK